MRPDPQPCPCENGGICQQTTENMELSCQCLEGYSGQTCQVFVAIRLRVDSSLNPAAIIIPLVLILLVTLGATAFYIILRKKNFGSKQLGNISSLIGGGVVSFRQGSNVEFGGPQIVSPSFLLLLLFGYYNLVCIGRSSD